MIDMTGTVGVEEEAFVETFEFEWLALVFTIVALLLDVPIEELLASLFINN